MSAVLFISGRHAFGDHQFFQRLTFLFSFGGLKAYKAKFASHWEPRYVIYRHAFDLPRVGVALGKVSKLK